MHTKLEIVKASVPAARPAATAVKVEEGSKAPSPTTQGLKITKPVKKGRLFVVTSLCYPHS